MKRSLFFAFICLMALGSGAQNIPQFVGEYLPYHQFITQQTPTVNGVRGNSSNQLKDFTAHFPYAELHYVNEGSNGWNIKDSSTFTYVDSLPFAIADTVLAYVSSNQSWVLDSEFSVSAFYVPNPPINDQDSFQGTKTWRAYNTLTSTWSNTYQYSYEYDSLERDISNTSQIWNSGSSSWTNVSKVSYSYNSSGLIDTLSTYTWNGTNNDWQADTQYIYVFTTYNYDSIVYVNVGNGGTTWNLAFEYNYLYTPIIGVFTGMNIFSWNGSSWVSYGVYTYNRNNNQATYLLQLYNGGTQLINTYEEIYNLDYRNNILSFENDSFSGNTPMPLIQYTYAYDIDNDVTFEQDAYWNGSSYYPTDQYYYYYEWRSVTGINDVSTPLSASIFPNPSNGEVNIRLDAEISSTIVISVYDVSGRMVSRTNANVAAGDNTLPMQLTQLAAGSYLINIKDPNNGESSNLNWIKQ